MKRAKDWVEWLMHNYRLSFLLIGLAFVLGFIGLDKMQKAEFPDFTIRQGIVMAVYPGAIAEEVEAQVARPLERYLFTYDEVNRKKTTSTSSNGMCMVLVELQDRVNNKDEVWSKIRHGLNTFKAQLPQGVLALAVNDDFGATSALLLAIESEQRSYRELKDYSDDLADELRRIKTVDNVVIYGDTREQISIYVDRERLSAYGIGQIQLLQTLNNAGMTVMSGSITNWQKNIPIHVKPSVNSEADIENTIIFSDDENHVVRVKDVATVKREYDLSKSYIEHDGHPCIILSLEMVPGNNIVQYGRDVQAVMDTFMAEQLPADVHVHRIADQCKVVGDSVTDFLRNLIESMVIIILVMLILFPWRTALVAGFIVPLSTFVSVAVMYLCGIPLNTVTLAGLIIVLGMVVDNAIVVLDGYLEYLNKGYSLWYSAYLSVKQYFMPMMLATVCLCAIFFPFLFTTEGMVYDMVHHMPWTVAINLTVSLVIAVVVLPILEYAVIKRQKPTGKVKKDITYYVQEGYNITLAWTFRHPKRTILGGIVLVILCTVLIGPRLKVRMLPIADRNQFSVEITLPDSKGLTETRALADSVRHLLEADERVISVTSFIGCSSPRFHTAYAPKPGGRNYAQLIVNTTSTHATEEVLEKFDPMSEAWPHAFVKFKQLDYQIFTPFEFRFYGEDADSLHRVANDVLQKMRRDPRVLTAKSDWDVPRSYIEVELDPVSTAQIGMNRTLAELELMMGTGDVQVGQVWEGDYQIPLVMKDIHNEELDCNSVNDVYLSMGNVSFPLRQIGEARPAWGETKIMHRNGLRCMTVNVEPKYGVYTNALQGDFADIINNEIDLPRGVRFEIGGEPENDTDTTKDVSEGLIVAVIVIFFFILFNFKTYKLTFVSLAALALCLPGALIGLWIMGRPVGVTGMFGLITLLGMIMRNEILIFEHAEGLRKEGWSARDAAFDAGRRRMVPIFLTTATTAVGVVPMILAATNFWMPVGVSIFAGGIGALILVVTILPVVYWKLYQKKGEEKKYHKAITNQIHKKSNE